MKTKRRLAKYLSAILAILTGCLTLEAQTRIESNEAREGNLAGREEADTWVFEVAEDNSDLHFEIVTEAGTLLAAVKPFGQNKAIKIIPVGGKGKSRPGLIGVFGQKIEATQTEIKLPAGKYQLEVKAYRSLGGSYRVRIIAPALGKETPAADAPLPERQQASEGPQSGNSQLKVIDELRRRVDELERRVALLEAAEKVEKTK